MSKSDSLFKHQKRPGTISKTKTQVKSKMECMLSVLNKLECREAVTVHALKDEFNCSERTAYRYIQTLQDMFPVYYDKHKCCYVFGDGYSLRKPGMTFEETTVFTMAKKIIGNLGPEMEQYLNSIEQKLSAKKNELPKDIVLSGECLSPAIASHFGALFVAILNCQRVVIDYKALYSDEVSHRTIEPSYLFVQDDLWYLRAYCTDKKELRTFAMDRILVLQITDEYFISKIDGTPEEDFAGAFGAVVDGDASEVILRFNAGVKGYILRKKWHTSQQVSELDDGRLEVRFIVNGLDGIRPWIYRWLPYVEVVAPKELKAICKDELKAALERL